jgi:hypothetical protein
MSTTKEVSRRAIMSGAAALPAAAMLPAVAAVSAPTAPDPIFAAIERHRLAYAELKAANSETSAAEERLPKDFWGEASTPIPLNITPDTNINDPELRNKLIFRHCRNVEEIDEALATNCNPEKHPELRRRAIKSLRAERAKFARAKKRAGLPQAEERANLADDYERETLQSLALTIPSTSAGVQAVLKYWWEYQRAFHGESMLSWEMTDTMRLLTSIYQAVGFIGQGKVVS